MYCSAWRYAVLLLIGCMGTAQAQTGFWGPPENLGSPVNTSQNELSGVLLNDGNELYFSRTVGGQNDLFVSLREGDRWGRPAALNELNTPLYNELNPTFTPDGSRMFFTSNRAGGTGEFDIYTTERTGSVWSAPVLLGPEINTSNSEWYAAVGQGGIFVSARTESGFNRGDIFFSSGTFPNYEMRAAIPALATPEREMSVYPTPDGNGLYITRGSEGAPFDDLWLSINDHGEWAPPQLVLCDVNTPEYDQYPTLSPSGSELLFASPNQAEGNGGWDLYLSEWHALGDMNADGLATSADIVYLVTYLFGLGPTPMDPRVEDVTCDGHVSILDIVVLANYVLRLGPVPCIDCSIPVSVTFGRAESE